MNEDVMITETGRAKAIYDELKDQWEVTITSENRSDLRKVHDEMVIWCKDNDMTLGILQQKTIKYDRIEEVKFKNPNYNSPELLAKIKEMDTNDDSLTVEELEQKNDMIQDYLTAYRHHEQVIPEWSAKCIVRRGSQ